MLQNRESESIEASITMPSVKRIIKDTRKIIGMDSGSKNFAETFIKRI